MSLARKLNLKPGMKVRVVNRPRQLDLDDVVTTTAASADAVLVFVTRKADIRSATPAIDAARADRIAWIAYPKAGQLDTDLNRDILWESLKARKVQGVRQVAIDDVWSAMRFRPAKSRS